MANVVLFRNGTLIDGKVVSLVHSKEELLTIASSEFGISAKYLYTVKGDEIKDSSEAKIGDILFVSAGEPFIVVTTKNSSSDEMLVKENSSSTTVMPSSSEWILLNVGGTHFYTTRTTLVTKEPKSMLARMFAIEKGSHSWLNVMDKSGAYLIDRSPIHFEPILNYLRHGQLVIDKNINPLGVLEEAKFFGIDSLIPVLENLVKEEKNEEQLSLSRNDVVRTLITTSCTTELRFQGVNMAGADLSRLDLRHINFKYANMRNANLYGANLSYCCLERTDLSAANLEGAILHGVKMLCANLEGANLKSCNMEDPAGNKANMEGVNLKSANLEGSQMAGVNLRVATLKKANLQNCDLRGAVLAGADLENCDLSGSDLHEANLRGANLKNAAFELMLTPLHMSQAIR